MHWKVFLHAKMWSSEAYIGRTSRLFKCDVLRHTLEGLLRLFECGVPKHTSEGLLACLNVEFSSMHWKVFACLNVEFSSIHWKVFLLV